MRNNKEKKIIRQVLKFGGWILLFNFLFLIWHIHLAKAAGPIIINEIMYNLPGNDSGHEWIEIKNISTEEINLKDWRFNDGSNHLLNEPPKNGGQGSLIIPPGGYAILADKADIFLSNHPGFSGTVIDTVMSLGQQADRIYTLKILNSEGVIIDEISYNINLGANGNGYTLERLSDFSSQFCQSQNLKGTPGFTNNPSCSSLTPTPTSTPFPTPTPLLTSTITPSPTPTLTPTPIETISSSINEPPFSITPTVSPQKILVKILINEFIPNPEGSDEENEWIELYNAGETEVSLRGWQLKDASGKIYHFKDEIILAGGFLILSRPQTKITINNDAETLSLIAPQKEIASQISFSGGSKEGYSYSRFGPNDWRWTKILTPGKENRFSAESQQKSFVVSPSPTIPSSKIPYTNPESLSSLKKIVLPAIAIGVIFSLAALIFIRKFIP